MFIARASREIYEEFYTKNFIGLFLAFSEQEGGGASEALQCNFKTVNAMVTKLTQDDVDNNSSNFRCFVDMVT